MLTNEEETIQLPGSDYFLKMLKPMFYFVSGFTVKNVRTLNSLTDTVISP